MGIFQKLVSFKFRPAQPPSAIVPASPPPIAPISRKSLADLERELERESAAQAAVHQRSSVAPKRRSRLPSKLIWMAVLLGIPAGVLWAINLPYSPIRRPIAQTAPMLLLPSYISLDHNYRQAIAALQQATQLIDRPTSAADLDLGAEKLQSAQASLDALPIGLLDSLSDYRYWWYDGYLTPSAFNASRSEAGRLQAKVFQERNAQNQLLAADQAVATAQQQYQQAQTAGDKQSAIANWRSALDQLSQIPGQTWAGKTAQQQWVAKQRDFQQTVGLAAGNQKIATLIAGAQQFSWQAAKMSQNPPHSVAEWQQIEGLWSEAINRLKQIPAEDLTGYAEAQRSLATYQANLGQTKIRHQAEADAVTALQSAKGRIETLLGTSSAQMNKRQILSQLQGIINELEKVPNGTTAYPEAQNLLLSAKNKLNQVQP